MKHKPAPRNAFYAQSGGVTAVINASACGVIETARKHKDRIGKLYAGRHGIIGALTEDLIDTTKESDAAIAALRSTPSGAFGSCRFKLKSLEANKREYERLIRQKRLEGWRERLIGDDAALTDFASENPGADLQALRTLIRNARKEIAESKPPRAQRELFRFLREAGGDTHAPE